MISAYISQSSTVCMFCDEGSSPWCFILHVPQTRESTGGVHYRPTCLSHTYRTGIFLILNFLNLSQIILSSTTFKGNNMKFYHSWDWMLVALPELWPSRAFFRGDDVWPSHPLPPLRRPRMSLSDVVIGWEVVSIVPVRLWSKCSYFDCLPFFAICFDSISNTFAFSSAILFVADTCHIFFIYLFLKLTMCCENLERLC